MKRVAPGYRYMSLNCVGELNPKDSATDCYCLIAWNSQSNVTLGSYTVMWKRCGDTPSQVLTSTVSFPPVAVKYQAYSVSAGELLCLYNKDML